MFKKAFISLPLIGMLALLAASASAHASSEAGAAQAAPQVKSETGEVKLAGYYWRRPGVVIIRRPLVRGPIVVAPPVVNAPAGSRYTYWHRRCVANWGYNNSDYRGCMKYYGY